MRGSPGRWRNTSWAGSWRGGAMAGETVVAADPQDLAHRVAEWLIPRLAERRRWVAAVAHGRPEVRLTLTYPALESSRVIAFLVTGANKAGILKAVRSGTADVPAARLQPQGQLIWFVDRAAAGEG